MKKVIFCLLCCYFTPVIAASNSSVIPHTEFSVNNISLGSKYDKVISIFGKPLSIEQDVDDGLGKTKILKYKGLTITCAVYNDEVGYILLTGKTYQLPSGITVGSTMKSVIKAYGHTQVYLVNDQMKVNYPVAETDSVLIIRFNGDKVDEILFFFPYI